MFAREVSDGNGCGLLDGDDHTDIALDALDATLHASKLAFGDLHCLTGLAGEVEIVEPNHLVALLGGDTDEIVHHGISDIEHFGMFRVVWFQHGAHDVTDRLIEGFLLLDTTEIVVGDTDKEEVVDSWGIVHLLSCHLLETHGDKGPFHAWFFFEERLQPHEPRGIGMADAKGEPVDLVAFQHSRLDEKHILGSPHFRNMATTAGPSLEIIFVVLIISDL